MTDIETKYVFWLILEHRRAVVIGESGEEAKLKAQIHDNNLDWGNAQISIISNVRRSRTSMILAMDK